MNVENKKRAVGGNRTLDLCLTKASLYPLATTACVFVGKYNYIIKIMGRRSATSSCACGINSNIDIFESA